MRSYGGKVAYVVENYGDSELARRFGVTRYPAIFVDDILVAKPKDFGFYGKGEGGGDGRYTPWKDAASHERFRADLKRMVDIALAGERDALRKERAEDKTGVTLATLPVLNLPDLSGTPLKSEDLKGQVVLVEFWATWCPPCRGTLSWLGQLKQRYGNHLTIVALAVESDESEVRKVVTDAGLPLRWAMGNADVARKFGDLSAVPTLFLFDSKSNLVDVFYGAPPDLHQKAEAAIQTVIQ